ncbi:di-trans,poly-cis-decaprenylcistransferase [Candidatus Woesearchaeota archaeon]|nr:MAG: di-trans,poly-cis-decaprenylcistransferase [Candidatus Woesearchaeota archaeon]
MTHPTHVALLLKGHSSWNKGRLPTKELYEKVFSHARDAMHWQQEQNIPVMTLNLLSSTVKEREDFPEIMHALKSFFETLLSDKFIHEHQIKISIFGKWYDLPGRVSEAIKLVIDDTKDYDKYFFNLCVNYSGQQEIVDAAKIIALKVISGKTTMNNISSEDVKDTIYSSSFPPPDLLIKTGKKKKLYGFLLWDATRAHIHFANKPWMNFTQRDLLKAIKEWEKEN